MRFITISGATESNESQNNGSADSLPDGEQAEGKSPPPGGSSVGREDGADRRSRKKVYKSHSMNLKSDPSGDSGVEEGHVTDVTLNYCDTATGKLTTSQSAGKLEEVGRQEREHHAHHNPATDLSRDPESKFRVFNDFHALSRAVS